jgi:Leucine-rich repeat (LRR) protein
MILNEDLVRRHVKGELPTEVTKLKMTQLSIAEVGDLSAMKLLRRLDLSQNQITSVGKLFTCQTLGEVSLSDNRLRTLDGLVS